MVRLKKLAIGLMGIGGAAALAWYLLRPPAPFWPTETVASDGKSLVTEPQEIQDMFTGMWGAAAEVRWCYEHNVELG